MQNFQDSSPRVTELPVPNTRSSPRLVTAMFDLPASPGLAVRLRRGRRNMTKAWPPLRFAIQAEVSDRSAAVLGLIETHKNCSCIDFAKTHGVRMRHLPYASFKMRQTRPRHENSHSPNFLCEWVRGYAQYRPVAIHPELNNQPRGATLRCRTAKLPSLCNMTTPSPA